MSNDRDVIRRPHGWLVWVSLLLFLGGSNLCVLSALAGAPMSCLSSPAAAAKHSSHCGRAMPGSSHGGGPSTAGNSPCCVNVALVPTPQIGKVEAMQATPVAVSCEGPSTPAMPAGARHSLDANESPPLALDFPAFHLGRAPPLS